MVSAVIMPLKMVMQVWILEEIKEDDVLFVICIMYVSLGEAQFHVCNSNFSKLKVPCFLCFFFSLVGHCCYRMFYFSYHLGLKTLMNHK